MGDVDQITKDEVVLWCDLAWERWVTEVSIDEGVLWTSIEISDQLMEITGNAIELAKQAKLITAIYQLKARAEGGVDRSV